MPTVSVLMPVYNGEKYLKDAIKSILTQTYSNFEFLIINDGSTDHTSEVISSFGDKRIKTINHKNNLGLVSSLNEGIIAASGKYIARMDADDISLPTRLQKQVSILDSKKCAVVAARIILIDENGKRIGEWNEDKENINATEIKNQLPKGNCIAHPTVVFRREIVSQYLYDTDQPFYTEDYDLWLRLIADGYEIEKVNDILLKYRIRHDSFSKQTASWIKLPRTRFVFFVKQVLKGKVGRFQLLVFLNIFPELKEYIHGKFIELYNTK